MATIVGRTAGVPFPTVPVWVPQLGRYGVVGGLGTVLSAVSYLVFRTWWDAVPANLAAVVLSTLVSTEVNRRFTFRGARADRVREHLQNAGTVAFYALYSSTVLVLVPVVVDDATAVQETAAVAVASVVGGVARFVVLRAWVFAPRPVDGPGAGSGRAAQWRDDPSPGGSAARAGGGRGARRPGAQRRCLVRHRFDPADHPGPGSAPGRRDHRPGGHRHAHAGPGWRAGRRPRRGEPRRGESRWRLRTRWQLRRQGWGRLGRGRPRPGRLNGRGPRRPT